MIIECPECGEPNEVEETSTSVITKMINSPFAETTTYRKSVPTMAGCANCSVQLVEVDALV